MARLSEAVLETGRGHIRALDLDGFMAWAGACGVPIDLDLARSTFAKIFQVGDTGKALAMFEAGWAHEFVDEAETAQLAKLGRRVIWGGFALVVLGIIGAVGGAVYLVTLAVGLL